MRRTSMGLDFEAPILELETHIEELQKIVTSDPSRAEELRAARQRWSQDIRGLYDRLTPWQRVKVARHADRPQTKDYVSLVFDEFVELHGDRHFGDDRALLTGFAKLGKFKVMLIGHQKGRNVKERSECYFGCAHPEGYRKALHKMKLAAKFGIPLVCLIDTPGAYPGVGAEERGQSQAIAENMFEMSLLRVPIVCVVIGEGGSGGALGIGVGDRVAVLENSYYSVISPEGCAGIIWKSHEYAEKAADALKFTSTDLIRLGVIDEIIPEPLGGAHRDHHQTAASLKRFLLNALRDLAKLSPEQLPQARYDKFRRMGIFDEAPVNAS
ncbi:MAG TPA: acetyl-CoA carboxylase carboxyltransferase subunit alpha [Pirellulaceae bacterium]